MLLEGVLIGVIIFLWVATPIGVLLPDENYYGDRSSQIIDMALNVGVTFLLSN